MGIFIIFMYTNIQHQTSQLSQFDCEIQNLNIGLTTACSSHDFSWLAEIVFLHALKYCYKEIMYITWSTSGLYLAQEWSIRTI